MALALWFMLSAALAGGDAAAGAALYAASCAVCHGGDGSGSVSALEAVGARPGSLADARRMGRLTDEELVAVIRDGGLRTGRSGLMPGWGRVLAEQQQLDLVAWIRALSQPTRTSEVVAVR